MTGLSAGDGGEPCWRPMRCVDLSGIVDLSRRIHPSYPESFEAFRAKLSLFPSGCLVLERAGRLVGYLFSHPWVHRQPPALDSVLRALPDHPDAYFIHDLTLDESVRGMGLADEAVAQVVVRCKALRIPALDLVAVSGAESFWIRHGFRRTDDEDVQRAVRSAYSRDAVHMSRPVGG